MKITLETYLNKLDNLILYNSKGIKYEKDLFEALEEEMKNNKNSNIDDFLSEEDEEQKNNLNEDELSQDNLDFDKEIDDIFAEFDDEESLDGITTNNTTTNNNNNADKQNTEKNADEENIDKKTAVIEDISNTVKAVTLLNKFEDIYFNLMIIKSKLEKIVSNHSELWNEIKKFELILLILIKKANIDNIEEINEVLEVYQQTLLDYIKNKIKE